MLSSLRCFCLDIDILDATHESLVPLEEEQEELEEDHSMEMERDQLMDTVASLAHGIGRAHRQRGELSTHPIVWFKSGWSAWSFAHAVHCACIISILYLLSRFW